MIEVPEGFEEHAEFFGDPANPDPLDPELAAYLAPNSLGGEGVFHPLVHQPFYAPRLSRMLNRAIAYKREAVERAASEGDWHSYVFLHERPYRHHAFRNIAAALDDVAYWGLLSDVWHDSENVFQWGDDVREFFEGVDPEEDAAGEWGGVLGDRDGRWEGLTDEVDRRAFALLDDEVLIYRGFNGNGSPDGWSWTTDHLIALFFARRFAVAEQHLVVGRVRKADVIAYTQARGESEVIVDPDDVYDVEEVELSPTCECGLPVPVTERIGPDRHAAHHRAQAEKHATEMAEREAEHEHDG